MIDIAKAIKIIDRETHPLSSERVALADAVGRVLQENIVADTDLPPFDRSQMDGYAVIAADTLQKPVRSKINLLDLVGESAAGRGWHKTLKRGQAVRIMTGAPLPKGADAVQKIEVTREPETGVVEVLESTEKGRYIVRRGSEIKKGKVLFKPGDIISENMVPTLASFGYERVKVGKRPRVAILGTGSEIVDISKKPGRDQIRNSNSVMLDVLCQKFGAAVSVLPIAKDDISNLKSHISNSLSKADILIITGGVSVGKYDHTKTALAELGAEIFFEKIRLKPGKPAVFARVKKTLVFGLPGNPVSAAVTFHLFARKAMLKMQGAVQTDAKTGTAVLRTDAKGAKERDTLLPSTLATDDAGRLVATPLKWLGSSDFVSFSKTNALVFVPRGELLKKDHAALILFL
jgi:molybdenum cofactor synthesis domain-containing protein